MERQECAMRGGLRKVPDGMDRLGAMMEAQARFAGRFFSIANLTKSEREKWIKEMCLCVGVEAVELLDEVNWKHWKKQQKELDVEQARFEVADLLCFVFNLAILLGMDAESIYQYYTRKAEINNERQAKNY